MGSGERTIRSLAVRVRYAGLFLAGAGYGGPSCDRGRGLHHRDVSALAQGRAGIHYRTAGGDSERHLWIMGNFCDGAPAARVRGAAFGALLWLDWVVWRNALWNR